MVVGNGTRRSRFELCAVAAYSVLSYTASLRGNEGFLLDLFGLRQYILKGKHDPADPHVAAPLLGRLKGEDGERYHMLLITSQTALGLKAQEWLECLVGMRERQGLFHGPAFCNEEGDVIQMSEYEETFYDVLHKIQGQRPDLVGPVLNRSMVFTDNSDEELPHEQERWVSRRQILI
jgi:hypothetical protein